MPIVTIQFKLPEEKEEYALTLNAGKLHALCWNFEQMLRQRYKHTEPASKAAYKEYEAIKKMWFEIIEELEVEL